MFTWIKALNQNDVMYAAGITCLFVGLTLRVSLATALIVVGAIVTVEAVITSYLATWLILHDQPAVKKEK